MQTTNNEKKKFNIDVKRSVTSVCYVVILVALLALKICVTDNWGALGFDVLFCAVAIIGSFEFLRAIDSSTGTQAKISTPQRVFTIAFCALSIPLFVAVQLTIESGYLAVALAFCVYAMFLTATSVFDHNRSTVKGTISCVFCMLYCGILPVLMAASNHLENNTCAAILLLFISTAFTDSGAYIFGRLFKRWLPYKLAPHVSPNKTIIGAVGGVLGGIVGGIVAYYCTYIPGAELVYGGAYPLVAFVLIGLCTGVLAQVGDLFESAIKRECGIKDMGNILPGHGGMLDRFDSMLYCVVVVIFSFGLIFT